MELGIYVSMDVCMYCYTVSVKVVIAFIQRIHVE